MIIAAGGGAVAPLFSAITISGKAQIELAVSIRRPFIIT